MYLRVCKLREGEGVKKREREREQRRKQRKGEREKRETKVFTVGICDSFSMKNTTPHQAHVQ